MAVTQQIIDILRSNETARVSFSFKGSSGNTISIDPAGFRTVANALANGSIAVVEGRFDSDKAMYSAWADAATNVEANTFYLGRNPRYSRLFNALIVHESVHAIFDLNKVTIPWLDNEAAAYIAQAMYARNSGLPRTRFEFGSQTSVAYLMVEGMVAGNTSDIDFFLKALRDSLDASPQYHSYIRGTFTGDG